MFTCAQYYWETLSTWDGLAERSTKTSVSLGNDEVSSIIPIGFSFEFMGTNVTQL